VPLLVEEVVTVERELGLTVTLLLLLELVVDEREGLLLRLDSVGLTVVLLLERLSTAGVLDLDELLDVALDRVLDELCCLAVAFVETLDERLRVVLGLVVRFF